MIKKLKSIKGSSLTVAIMVLVVVSTISIGTLFLIGTNSRRSIVRVNALENKVVLENSFFDCLNILVEDKTNIPNEINSNQDSFIYFTLNDQNDFVIGTSDNFIYKLNIKLIDKEESLYHIEFISKDNLKLNTSLTILIDSGWYKIKTWRIN